MQTSQATPPQPNPNELGTQAAQAGDPPSLRPGARTHDWAEPGEEPILDAARVPLKSFRDNRPAYQAYIMYAWLHILRPVLLVAFWVGVVLYAWRHFFRPTEDMQDVSLLGLYALLVAGIFVVMLLIAPIRHFIRKDEDREAGREDSTAFDVADYADVPSRRLFSWRRARSLVVRHDRAGNLRDAADMDAQPVTVAAPTRHRQR